VYDTQDYRDFGLFPLSSFVKNTTFQKVDLSPTHCSSEYRTMDKVQKLSNPDEVLSFMINCTLDISLHVTSGRVPFEINNGLKIKLMTPTILV
jgi:hypothetical protein